MAGGRALSLEYSVKRRNDVGSLYVGVWLCSGAVASSLRACGERLVCQWMLWVAGGRYRWSCVKRRKLVMYKVFGFAVVQSLPPR